MKNIGVLVPDFSVEHCQDFVKGVIDYYSSMPDVNVFIVQTFLVMNLLVFFIINIGLQSKFLSQNK